MNGEMLFGSGFLAVASALLLCLGARPVGRLLGVIDHPDGVNGRKRHKGPTPLTGGLAVMLPTLFAITLFLPGLNGAGLAILTATSIVLVIGLVDDRGHLKPGLRLALSSLALLGALLFAPDLRLWVLHFSFMSYATSLGPVLGILLALICLLGLQNAVNMADGKNGLVIGLSLIWTVFLMIAAPTEWLPVLLALFLALGVTFAFNIKGRLFLGDAGSYSISILLGLLSIYVFNHSRVPLPADIILIWFLVPVLDCLRLIVTRARDGRRIFSGDRNHLHHLIYDAMPWRFGLPLYLSMVFLPGLFAMVFPEAALLFLLATIFVYTIVYISYARRPLGVGGMS